MKQAFVVVGAGFGDEAKGMTTCKIAERFDSLPGIFRFNGGAQAGHTVQHGNYRVVNQSLNSANFAGVTTTLYTKDVVVNPIVIEKEIKCQESMFYRKQKVCVSEYNPWTCAMDSEANRIIAKHFGGNATCGFGINETLRRHEVIPIDTYAAMFGVDLFNKIGQTQDYYMDRFNSMGIPDEKIPEMYKNKSAVQFITKQLLNASSNWSIETFNTYKPNLNRHLLFEGAQGLMLDQEFGEFPFVTPSYTGTLNVGSFIKENELDHIISPIYCIRTFLTRHGDGPFVEENPFLNTQFKYHDKTNISNEFQGNFKLGVLDIDKVQKLIWRDVLRTSQKTGVFVNAPVLSISHLDIFEDTGIKCIKNGKEHFVENSNHFISLWDFQVVVRGNGPDISSWYYGRTHTWI